MMRCNKEIEESKLFTRTLMHNNGISEPKSWRKTKDIKDANPTMFEMYRSKIDKTRNQPILVTESGIQTFDGPGITIETMEREKDRQFRKLRAEKLKVISRSLKRCFEPENLDITNLPFYKIVELEKQRISEDKEIKRLFNSQIQLQKMNKKLFKIKKSKSSNSKFRSKLAKSKQQLESHEEIGAHFFNSQSQIASPITVEQRVVINVHVADKIVEKPRSVLKRPKTTKKRAEVDTSIFDSARPSSQKTSRKDYETKVQFEPTISVDIQSKFKCIRNVFEPEKKMAKDLNKSNSSSSSSSSKD